MAYLAEAKNIWGPFVVVAPNSTLHQWKQELNKFCHELKVIPYWGTQKDRAIIRKFWKANQLGTRDAPFHVYEHSFIHLSIYHRNHNHHRIEYVCTGLCH